MSIDVSVVIPFFNPGANIEACLESLVAQTLPKDQFEVVLVDDGSTDGSLARVERWVARHPDWLSVHHLPASGGPGRPRNLGVGRSRGRFIQFLDSDDTLAPRALERLLEIADSSDADIVIGKLSSDFRGIHHPLFRHTVTGRTLDDYPLMLNLTVCKMFRREFLAEFGVRFPEGPHYVEDIHLCVQAYTHARSVAVVGDTACYFYRRRRTAGRNFGDTTIVPADYLRELSSILDTVDDIHTPETRRAFQARFYRIEMLGRLRGQAMTRYDDAYRREMVAQVRRLATARFGAEVHESLPAFVRTQSRLLLDNDQAGLTEFARHLKTIRLLATSSAPAWQDGLLVVDIEAVMTVDGEPFQLEPDGDGWLVPTWMAPGVDADDRRLRADDIPDLDLATISRSDSQLWSTTEGLHLEIDGDGNPRIRGEVTLDPDTLIGGTRLTPGGWNLRLRATVGGLALTSPIRPRSETAQHLVPAATAWVTSCADRLHSVCAGWAGAVPTLGLDVDEWSDALHDLVVDQLTDHPPLSQRRHLVIPAPGVRGRAGDTAPARLTLQPLDAEDLGIVTCRADLDVDPTASTIRATIPGLPKRAGRWAVWLRIGELGGPPSRRLPVDLTQSRWGKVRVTAAG